MMTFRLLRSFRLLLPISLKTSSDRWHCVPLFLKLFPSASLGFFFLEICLIIVQNCFWWFLIPCLGVVPFVQFLGLIRLSFSLSFREVLRSVRACLVGFHIISLNSFFSCLALHIPMGPGHSSVLRIGSDSSEASGSRQTGGESHHLAVVVP